MDGEHAIFAYSGIGDTIAAIYGREVGISGWHPKLVHAFIGRHKRARLDLFLQSA